MQSGNDIVLSYVPRVLAELARTAGPPPWGLELDGTLVMADVSGFTTISERLARLGPEGAERLTHIINRFFGRMLEVADAYGGDTLTFAGDAILILFHGPGHADRAVTAATGMLAETRRVPSFEITGQRVKLRMSVGAHTDTFLLAAAGLPEYRMQFLVFGEQASRTAAAEARAGSGELIVSPETAASLRSPWTLVDADGWLKILPGDPAGRSVPPEKSPAPELADCTHLLPFAPPVLRASGGTDIVASNLRPEHRRVTVVFVGVDGLNRILKDEGSEAALSLLQDYMGRLVETTERHSGYLVSTDISSEGFKLIIAFGAPVAHEFAAENAARFALEIRGLDGATGGRLRQRIGVNGGHVFTGDVGPDRRRQYTVMGDEVNLAARLMGRADPGTITAAHSWTQHVSPRFCVDEPTLVRVKGKADEIAVCTLRDETMGRESERHEETPFLGRESELARFREVWKAAAAGRGTTLFVRGEPGVGKTRFFDEALRGLELEPRSVRAFCEEHLQGIPFAPWVELLRSILGLDGSEDTEESTAVVAEALQRWAGDMLDLGSLLNPLLRVDLPPSDVVSSLGKQARRERLVELIVRMAVASCPNGGGILLIEDMDWADDSSIEAVAQLARVIRNERFLLLLSARTADPLPELPESATTLVLPELSRAESIDLIRRSLGGSDLPEAVADALHAKTRGNPLFLEEVVHSLGVPGVLDRILQASSVSQAAELATLAIPDRVQGLLMSRLDAIPIQERELLKVASVVGREFDRSLLDGLHTPHVEEESLDGLLESLGRASIIISAADTGTFRFRHALMQEVAYESLPYAQRREIHAAIADHLDSSNIRPDHGLLVHHYTRAGDGDHARVHAVRAAESSQNVYAFREAIDYLSIAVATAPSPTPEHACMRSYFEESIGDCLESIARHDEAVTAYQKARRRWRSPAVRAVAPAIPADIAPLADADARESDLCRKIAVCVEHQHADYRRALLWLRKAERLLPPNRAALAARLEVGRENILFRLGRLAEALVHGERGLALARAEGDKALQAYALAMLNNPLVGQGMLDRAIEVSREAVTLYEESGDLAGQATSHGNLAACYQLVGDLRSSLVHHETALSLNERLGYVTGASIVHNNIAEVLLQLGRTDEAIDHLRQVVEAWEERRKPPVLVGFALVNLSKGLLRQGEKESAGRTLDEGRRLLAHAGARGLLIEADIQAAHLALEMGHLDEARSACLEAVDAAKEAGAKLNEAQALYTLGRVDLACRDIVEAEDHLHSSMRLAGEIGADYERGLALLAVSELYALHDPTEDDRHVAPLAEAIALFEGMGAEHDLCRAVELRDACVPDL